MRSAPFGGVGVWQGVQPTCGGILTPEQTATKFNGRTIFELDTTKFCSHYTYFASGKMLIWALTKDAQSQRSQIMLGTWACGDAQVRIIRRFDDPASLQKQQNRDSFPYHSAKHFS